MFCSIVFQEQQFVIWLNHTSLLTAILSFCSVQPDEHIAVHKVLHRLIVSNLRILILLFDVFIYALQVGGVKPSELEKELNEKGVKLSPLAVKS